MTVDYIIVGAGSAGCVLASRLTENPEITVALIEAGPEDKKREIHIPAAFSELFHTSVDWAYETIPQPGAGGRRLFLPRGKVLGGSSSINAMIYIRGHQSDYDEWEKAGNPGWSYEDLLPYFKKSESNTRIKDTYHGEGGPMQVRDLNDPRKLSHDFLSAAEEVGYRQNPDFNGARQEGFGLYQVTQKGGKRVSTSSAFLKPIKSRKNLHVLTRMKATGIIWEKKRAAGVIMYEEAKKHAVKARREVILSAGAYNSPQLLMLSGIGDSKELTSLGIEVKSDLPGVGKNLQDHLIVPMVFDTYEQATLESARSVTSLVNYLVWAEGPLSSNVAEAGGFIKTLPDLSAPDIQFHFGPGYFYNHGIGIPKKGNGFSLGPTLLKPESMGEVKLASPHGSAAPIIDHAYLQAEADLQTLIRGLKAAMKIVDAPSLRKHFKGFHLPDKRLRTEEEMAQHIRRHAQTLYHPVGTARMGKDKLAVVDARLKVKGVEGLRVVDASVMPTIVRGNTNAPVIAIAEKGADLILEDHKAQKSVVSVPAR